MLSNTAMSESNSVEHIALSLAAIRRDIATLARIRGDRLTRSDVCERLGIHRNTLRGYMENRGFPTPGKDGKWLLAEVMEWESYRAA